MASCFRLAVGLIVLAVLQFEKNKAQVIKMIATDITASIAMLGHAAYENGTENATLINREKPRFDPPDLGCFYFQLIDEPGVTFNDVHLNYSDLDRPYWNYANESELRYFDTRLLFDIEKFVVEDEPSFEWVGDKVLLSIADQMDKPTSRRLQLSFFLPNRTETPVFCRLFELNKTLIIYDNHREMVSNFYPNLSGGASDDNEYVCHRFIGSASEEQNNFGVRSSSPCLITFCRPYDAYAVLRLPSDGSYWRWNMTLSIEPTKYIAFHHYEWDRFDDYIINILDKGAKFILGHLTPKYDHYQEYFKERYWPDSKTRPTDEQQLLTDSTPPNSHIIRVIVLVSFEAMQGDIIGRSIAKGHQLAHDTINLVNFIWSRVNISVYATKPVVWWSLAISGAEPWEDKEWGANLTYLHMKVAANAEKHLWPRVDNADFLIAIMNLSSIDWYVNGEVNGFSLPKTVCGGTYANSPGRGSLIGVRALGVKSWKQGVQQLASAISYHLGISFGLRPDNDGISDYVMDSSRRFMSDDPNFRYGHEFSPTSKADLRSALSMLPPLCLKHIPIHLPGLPTSPRIESFTRNICGNGAVEHGEECDCGPVSALDFDAAPFCPNPECCDRAKCKLKTGAQCANGPCCNKTTCQYHPKDTLCRPAIHPHCDLEEYCTGYSIQCPQNTYLMTGSECGEVGEFEATCYKGNCVSRDRYCRDTFGGDHRKYMSLVLKENCYEKNMRGSETYNCGHSRFLEVVIPAASYRDRPKTVTRHGITSCNKIDSQCGNIQCSDYNSTLPLFSLNYNYKLETINNDDNTQCFSFAGRMLPDYGHVPNGVLCGNLNDKRYCMDKQCKGVLPKCAWPPCDNFGVPIPNRTFSPRLWTYAPTLYPTLHPPWVEAAIKMNAERAERERLAAEAKASDSSKVVLQLPHSLCFYFSIVVIMKLLIV